jgi:hypothetical protein
MRHQTAVANRAATATRAMPNRENFDGTERFSGGLEGTEKNGFGLYPQARKINCSSGGTPGLI